MKISLKDKLIIYLKSVYPHFIHSGTLERFGMDNGFKGETTGRRLRELADIGRIERRMNGKSVEYRFKAENDVVARINETPAFKPKVEINQKLI